MKERKKSLPQKHRQAALRGHWNPPTQNTNTDSGTRYGTSGLQKAGKDHGKNRKECLIKLENVRPQSSGRKGNILYGNTSKHKETMEK